MKTIIRTQGSLVKVKTVHPSEKSRHGVGGKRGKVTIFSKASRKRLLNLFATLKPQKFIFITLTYGQAFPDIQAAKRHLKNFIQRLRNRYKNLSGVWRLEYQKRGAPHFHLLMTHLPFINAENLCKMWEGVIGQDYINTRIHNCSKCAVQCKKFGQRENTFTRIEMCKTKKKVMAYVAKYVAKSEPVSRASGASGFNNVAYQHASFNADMQPSIEPKANNPIYGCDTLETHQIRQGIIENYEARTAAIDTVGALADAPEPTEPTEVTPDHEGRWWGTIGKEYLPFAPINEVVHVGSEKVFFQFRRLFKRFYPHMRIYRAICGFSQFDDNAGRWIGHWIRSHSALTALPKYNCYGVAL